MSDSLATTISATDLVAVVRVAGELDLATAPELETALTACLDRPRVVEVDMQDVTFMACAGINVLIAASARASQLGASLTVVRPSASVELIVQLARVRWLLQPSDQRRTQDAS